VPEFLRRLLIRFNLIKRVPSHLLPNGRGEDNSFQEFEKLYRGFEPNDLDSDNGQIKTENLRFPDLSCNWEKFSAPEDVKYRAEGCEGDGCYSVTVAVVRFDDIATPAHDPSNVSPWFNYAHTEVRCLRQGENVSTIPPKGRKLPSSKLLKTKYRLNFVLNARVELEPEVAQG